MLIANPIYDVVFKYLFDDNAVAISFLSLILKKNIVKLDFRPTEIKSKIKNNETFFTIFRIDFSATIENSDGTKELVIIEIQKAKYHTDIMRFRRYLGAQYSDENNQYSLSEQASKEYAPSKALPIISIYFLGHRLTNTKAPVIKVARTYLDLSKDKNNIIEEKEEFIESLTHDSYIIQIPYLGSKRQTELLQVLSVFDQDNAQYNNHILNIDENQLPEKYSAIIRRLQKATAKKDLDEVMSSEDEILDELKFNERKIAEQSQRIAVQNSVISEKDSVIDSALKLLTSNGAMSENEARKKLGI